MALTNVVVLGLPFHCTTELLIKFVPFTVNVNAPDPALLVFGERVVIVGKGFDALIVNVSEFENVPGGAPCVREFAPPETGSGLNTTTDAVPTDAMSAAVIAAVN